MTLKVLHVIPSLSLKRGGPSVAVVAMAKALMREGVDVHIATTNDNGDTVLDVNCDAWTTIDGVPCRYFKRWSAPIRALREFSFSRSFNTWFRASAHSYDVIHVHALFSGISSYAMLSARRTNIPYVIRSIGQLETWSLAQSKFRKMLFLKLFEHSNLRHARFIHCTAPSEARAIASFDSSLNSRVIPLGIEDHFASTDFASQKQAAQRAFRLVHGIDPQVQIVLFLARLHPKKGLEHLLKALAKDANTSAVHLVVAGDGEQKYIDQLQGLAQELGLGQKCHFIGFVEGDTKCQTLLAADVYCLPSSNENFGISVLEALSAGCAAVVSSEVALAHDIQSKGLGAVVEYSRLTKDLGPALHQLLAQPSVLQEIGLRARKHALEHYSWQAAAVKLKAAYQD